MSMWIQIPVQSEAGRPAVYSNVSANTSYTLGVVFGVI